MRSLLVVLALVVLAGWNLVQHFQIRGLEGSLATARAALEYDQDLAEKDVAALRSRQDAILSLEEDAIGDTLLYLLVREFLPGTADGVNQLANDVSELKYDSRRVREFLFDWVKSLSDNSWELSGDLTAISKEVALTQAFLRSEVVVTADSCFGDFHAPVYVSGVQVDRHYSVYKMTSGMSLDIFRQSSLLRAWNLDDLVSPGALIEVDCYAETGEQLTYWDSDNKLGLRVLDFRGKLIEPRS